MSDDLLPLYAERAACVIALARASIALGHHAGFALDPAMTPKEARAWSVLFIDLPTGQVSWHLTATERKSAADIGDYGGQWDGHKTSTKYSRLARWKPNKPVKRGSKRR